MNKAEVVKLRDQNYKHALQVFAKVEQLWQQMNQNGAQNLNLSNQYVNIGDMYFDHGRFEKAFKFYSKSLTYNTEQLSGIK